jgi:hypothetical protein
MSNLEGNQMILTLIVISVILAVTSICLWSELSVANDCLDMLSKDLERIHSCNRGNREKLGRIQAILNEGVEHE